MHRWLVSRRCFAKASFVLHLLVDMVDGGSSGCAGRCGSGNGRGPLSLSLGWWLLVSLGCWLASIVGWAVEFQLQVITVALAACG